MAFFLLSIIGFIIVGVFEIIRTASKSDKLSKSRTFVEKIWDRHH